MSKKIIKSILAISIILIVAVAAISIGNIAPTSDSLGRGDSDAIISTHDGGYQCRSAVWHYGSEELGV